MKVEYYKNYSPCLSRDMELKTYGDKGSIFIIFPSQDGRFYDYEDQGMVEALEKYIDEGKIQLVCLDSIDRETYSATNQDPGHRCYLLEQYYYYVVDEVIPFIRKLRDDYSNKIYTSGCSLGAGHGANLFFRRPDLFQGTIALSGYYDSDLFFGDYMDNRLYSNTPIKYLGGMLFDHPYIQEYQDKNIIICCGQGSYEQEMVKSSRNLQTILQNINVPAWVDYWGYDVSHDWYWWKKQISYFIEQL